MHHVAIYQLYLSWILADISTMWRYISLKWYPVKFCIYHTILDKISVSQPIYWYIGRDFETMIGPQMEACKAVMVSLSTSRIEDEVGAGEEWAIHQQRSQGIPPRFLPVAHRKERFPTGKSASLDRSENYHTWKTMIKSDPPPWLFRTNPLLLHTCY